MSHVSLVDHRLDMVNLKKNILNYINVLRDLYQETTTSTLRLLKY